MKESRTHDALMDLIDGFMSPLEKTIATLRAELADVRNQLNAEQGVSHDAMP